MTLSKWMMSSCWRKESLWLNEIGQVGWLPLLLGLNAVSFTFNIFYIFIVSTLEINYTVPLQKK